MDTEVGVHDSFTPAHAGGYPAPQLTETDDSVLHPYRCEFAKYFHKSPDQPGRDHVRTSLLDLFDERTLAGRTIQGVRRVLKFLYNPIPFPIEFEAILLVQVSLQCRGPSNLNS